MAESTFWKERVRRGYASLRPSEQYVADYMLEHTEELKKLTIGALADRAQVSEPTVIRCVRGLGFTGYRAFKRALNGFLDEEKEILQVFDPLSGFSLRSWDKIEDLPLKTVHIETMLLEQALKGIVVKNLEQAVTYLANARMIDIYSVENSCTPASDILTKLTYLGLNCRMHTDAYLQQIAAAHLTKEDVAVAFSHSGCSADTVKALKLAHRSGAVTIAVSGRQNPVMKKYADIFLCAGGTECSIYGNAIFSKTSEMAVVDMLYMGIILSNYKRFSRNLDRSGAVIADREYTEI